jgi:hypothetical protein
MSRTPGRAILFQYSWYQRAHVTWRPFDIAARNPVVAAAIFWRADTADGIRTARLAHPRNGLWLCGRGHRRLYAHGHSQLDSAPALARIAAAFAPSVLLFHIAAFAWIAAFAGFAAAYGPLLIRHPPNWAKC